jgi:hypothetical protein
LQKKQYLPFLFVLFPAPELKQLLCCQVLLLRSALEFRVTPVLEGSNLICVVLGIRVAVLIDGCHRPGGLCPRFPLSVGRHLVHVIQWDGVLIVLSNSFMQISW